MGGLRRACRRLRQFLTMEQEAKRPSLQLKTMLGCVDVFFILALIKKPRFLLL